MHFESETWVCAECGALHACEHDDEELREGRAVEMTLDAVEEEEEDCCELVSVRGIEAGQEVFNSYGELSNSRLLAFYGFALEANKYDRITFAMDDILRHAPTPPPASANIAEDLGSLVKEWVSTHNPSSPFPESEAEDDPIIHDPTSHLYIDADAHLSSSLWLLLLLLHIPLPAARTKRHELLLRLKSAQCRRVHGAELQEGEAELGALDERALHLLVGAVRTLCAARVREQYAEEKTGAELLELAGVRPACVSSREGACTPFPWLTFARSPFARVDDVGRADSSGYRDTGERAHFTSVRIGDVGVHGRRRRSDSNAETIRVSFAQAGDEHIGIELLFPLGGFSSRTLHFDINTD